MRDCIFPKYKIIKFKMVWFVFFLISFFVFFRIAVCTPNKNLPILKTKRRVYGKLEIQ